MAKTPISAQGVLPVTTSAAVRYIQFVGFDENDPTMQIWELDIHFSGPSPNIAPQVTFSGTATAAQKRTAVRNIVNEQLAATEPGVTLNNAAIQVSGEPS